MARHASSPALVPNALHWRAAAFKGEARSRPRLLRDEAAAAHEINPDLIHAVIQAESAFNALVFAGLAMAVGIVVDDAVIDTDNIRRRLSQRGKDAGEVSRAVFCSRLAATRE